MSQGFTKWSNNPNSNLNIKAVRFGFKKPILEAELNELQDLAYLSTLNTNRVNNKPNTYTSNMGSKLYWKYENGSPRVAHLMLKSTSLNDVVKLVFSGGVEYFITPSVVGEEVLATITLPTNGVAGEYQAFVITARVKTYSPDPSDSDYDESVGFAADVRYSGLITTKRVVVESDFSYTGYAYDAYLDSRNEYLDFKDMLLAQKITGLNDNSEVSIILGAWRVEEDGSWGFVHEVSKEVMGVDEFKYELLSDGIETYGTYSVTPLIEGSSCEVRLDFPVKSIKYGYFALLIDGQLVTEGVPINHPLRTNPDILTQDRVTIGLYDLRDIVLDDEMWGNYTGQSWEDLLNQKWFSVDEYSVPSLIMQFNEVSRIGDVGFGSLTLNK